MKFAYLIEPPFNYRSETGAATGCDVELARVVGQMIGEAALEPVEARFAELLPGLAAGRWRMTTGLFATAERRSVATFSRPIWALSDGLLVRRANPKRIAGYRSLAAGEKLKLAVIRDQVQHRSALELGVPATRIDVCETYDEAARAVIAGTADAYASVARAHAAYVAQNSAAGLAVVTVPVEEKAAAFGSFGFALHDAAFRQAVDAALEEFLGSDDHRRMMRGFGFSDAEVDLIV